MIAREAFIGLLCGCVVAGQIRAQEVMVARDTKPSAPEPEHVSGKKAHTHAKTSSSAAPTLEQMRAAGAIAAERLNNPAVVERAGVSRQSPPRTAKLDTAPTPPVRKEKRIEQASSPRAAKSGAKKSQGMGPVRPTMIESGREETEGSQPKAEPGQTSTPPQSRNEATLRNRSTPKQHTIPG